MARVLKRPSAERDLLDIWNFIADDNLGRADEYLRHLNAVLQKVADAPLIGRLRPEVGPDIRSFAIDAYVVFYVALVDGIDVLRFVHSSRDLNRIF